MNLHVSTQRATDDLLARPNLRLRIGEQVVDVGALRLVTRPEVPRLTNKAVAVLIELVRHAGKTVTRDRLLDSVWAGRFTTPDVLTQAIKELRRAFGDDSKPSQYIETIPKVGYRLIAPVLALDGPDGGIFVESPDDDGDANDAVAASATGNDASPSRRRAWTTWLALIAAPLAAAAGIYALVHTRTPAPSVGVGAAPESGPDSGWHVEGVRALTSYPGAERRPSIAPDGTRIAFAMVDTDTGFDRIVIRSIEPSQLVHLTIGRNQHEGMAMWSPDGTRIAFERLTGRHRGCIMYVASSLGGDEREFGSAPDYDVNYYDWTPDGHGIITARQQANDEGPLVLMKIDLDSGTRTFLSYDRAPDDQDLEPHYSPDGKSLAFRRGIAPFSDLYVMAASGGAVRQVTHVAARIRGYAWSRDGSALVFASNVSGTMALYVTDVASGRTEPLHVSPAEYPNAARGNDNVVYEIPRTHNTMAVVALDGSAPGATIAPSTGSDYSATLSPTADRIAFVSDRSGQYQIWLYDRAAGTTAPLTEPDNDEVFSPRWSADGKRLLAVRHSEKTEPRELIEINVATRRQRLISAPHENVLFGAYGIDADSYLVVSGSSGKNNKLVLVTHPGTPDETRRIIESSVAYARVDRAHRAIYFTTTAGRGLYRLDIDSGQKRFVSAKVNAVSMNGWRIVDGRVWYLEGVNDKPVHVREIDPDTGTDRLIGKLDVGLRDLDFSPTPDRKSVVLSQLGTEDTDVGMFRLVRGSR